MSSQSVALDERLRTVASLVRRGTVVADIGTDHAYLPVYLVQRGICPAGIAADLRSGPLAAARAHVAEVGLTDRIALRLGDGLAPLRPGEAGDIVIAGMGGETIEHILSAADAALIRRRDVRLILQPMTHAEQTRLWLMKNGFSIQTERLVIDGRHLYPVIAAQFIDAPPSDDLVAAYAGSFSDGEGRAYRSAVARHLRRRADGIGRADPVAAAELNVLADRVEAFCYNG